MKSVKVFALLVILGINYSVAQSSEEQSVLNLSKQKFGWMQRQQFDSLNAILDDRLMFVHSSGWVENKQEIIEDMKSGKLKYVNIEISESSARVYPGVAIVNGKGKFSVVLDGNDFVINLFYTEVYILKNKKWLLASRHSNRLP